PTALPFPAGPPAAVADDVRVGAPRPTPGSRRTGGGAIHSTSKGGESMLTIVLDILELACRLAPLVLPIIAPLLGL
ncbi:hypothetical protein, partial [Nocardia noduli]|uniref:hypothetical protein n=1 Tax=Nocardia noduli TaxID=2815722 RepID=UPI001C248F3B